MLRVPIKNSLYLLPDLVKLKTSLLMSCFSEWKFGNAVADAAEMFDVESLVAVFSRLIFGTA